MILQITDSFAYIEQVSVEQGYKTWSGYETYGYNI